MSFTVRYIPEIENDLQQGNAWYEEKVPGLGDDFINLFLLASSGLAANPYLYSKFFGNFRRRLLKRFPYAIYYRVEEDEVIITGLFHCARNPRFIRAILLDREKQ